MKTSLTRRHFLQTAPIAAAAPLVARAAGLAGAPGHRLQVDVCVYGGVSGGVIAAVALARMGRSVALIEPTRHLGGMTTGGLGWVDVKIGSARAYGGITGEFYRRVRKYYASKNIDVMKFGNDGAVAEPHVAEAILEEMLHEQAKHITIFRESRIASVRKEGRRLRSIVLDKAPVDRRGAPASTPLERSFASVSAALFIDASYEGDLLAAAGISHRGDREGRDEYKEMFAGIVSDKLSDPNKTRLILDPYLKPGNPASGLLPLISDKTLGEPGSKSDSNQAFNFRLCLTKNNPLPIQPGSNYDPATYEVLARLLAAQAATGSPFRASQMHARDWKLLKFCDLPNGKTDVNNAGDISMDLVNGGAERYASASWAERANIWHAHEDYQRGLYHFLHTDPRVPEDIRNDLAQWGLARDEFQDAEGWPTQLYIREARRMVGMHVMRESDCDPTAPEVPDSIAIGTYSLDSHLCQRVAHRGQVVHEGGFYQIASQAYPITYKAVVPRAEECENLLATFCVSATHVCFASIRMEPPFMVLSESAAIAAHHALIENKSVQTIDLDRLARSVRDAGQIVIPSDIPQG